MKKAAIAFTLLLVAPFLNGGCAGPGPRFEAVSAIPSGHGLVYIYSLMDNPGGSNHLIHNNESLASLGPDQYFVQFAEPGPNTYGVQINQLTQGGGLVIGLLVNLPHPQPIVLQVDPGKTYYLKVIGAGSAASFWRVDDATALQELQRCHRVEIR